MDHVRARKGAVGLARILHNLQLVYLNGGTSHTHGYPMASDGVKMVKKSIFQLWSGIVLGWSEWPKNAPKVPEKYFFGSTMPGGGTLGCHLDTRPSTEIVIWP